MNSKVMGSAAKAVAIKSGHRALWALGGAVASEARLDWRNKICLPYPHIFFPWSTAPVADPGVTKASPV